MSIAYKCPECGSYKLLVYAETSYWLNTTEFFCHSTKTHDSEAKVSCTECTYESNRADLERAAREKGGE